MPIVVFEQGSRGFVGWVTNVEKQDKGDDATVESDDDCKSEDDGPEEYDDDFFYFDLMEAKFRVQKNETTMTTKMVAIGPGNCQLPLSVLGMWGATNTDYSIQLLENDSDAKIMDTCCTKKEMYPFITFRGKVTMSNVLYDF